MIDEELKRAIDNKTSLVNLSNSILQGLGAEPMHPVIPEVTSLVRGRKKVCLMLFDGMGTHVLNKHPKASKKLLEHKIMEISSVNPATTAAATISLLSGKYPMETGWLGWSIPLDGYEEPVDVFPSVLSGSKKKLKKDAMLEQCPLRTIDMILRDKGVRAELAYQEPIRPNTYKDLKGMMEYAGRFFKEGDGFLYLYYTNPDGLIHRHGVESRCVDRQIRDISKHVDRFSKEHPDVLVLVCADHGLLDVVYRDIAPYEDLTSLLSSPMAIEGRMRSVYLKTGKREEFKTLFLDRFGDDFHLVDSIELLEEGYFGVGEEHRKTRKFLGDFLIIPKGNQFLRDSSFSLFDPVLMAHHAGPLDEEKSISLLSYNA